MEKPNPSLTPLMRQYWEIKSAHHDKILFFRMGDFFELFHDDAVLAAPLIGVTLTARNKKSQDETPMCGVPHHSIAGPINKLLSRGYKVALCDQVEDPKEAKGIVKRAVTRVLSPGMVYDPETLDGSISNYLASFDETTLSFLDSTSGEAFYFEVNVRDMFSILEALGPRELVLSEAQREDWQRRPSSVLLDRIHLTWMNDQTFGTQNGEGSVSSDRPWSAQRLVQYVMAMQGASFGSFEMAFEYRTLQSRVKLSPQTLRHLEIFENYRGGREGTLCEAIDRTKTSSGARHLKQWMLFPLVDRLDIEKRQARIESWVKSPEKLNSVRRRMTGMGDVERRLLKLSHPGCHPRDLQQLALSLEVGCEVSRLAFEVEGEALSLGLAVLDQINDMAQQFTAELVDDPPLSSRSGGLIKRGVRSDLDELIGLTEDAHGRLLEMEAKERERTGISSLKIRYNSVFGYYIEVTHTHRAKVPETYQRKQTLVNAERFVTPELIELENKILSARVRRNELEYAIFCEMREKLLKSAELLLRAAQFWSELDVILSLSWLAIEQKYSKPMFSENRNLKLISSRHPVVEQMSSGRFIPNDIEMSTGECMLLTGPNMAGKSTLMRQVALTSLLAQIGSFVPARVAVLPLFDGIFTRIGSHDSLFEGLSTFMVEMTETAALLQSAGSQSLVILDEIGRGTSTFDGMSLAQAILEELCLYPRGLTFFATHYHELTELGEVFPQVLNFHMSIREKDGDISFLHTLKKGPANKSYGIHVAKKAGLPSRVLVRAEEILKCRSRGGGGGVAAHDAFEISDQMSLFAAAAGAQEKSEMPLSTAPFLQLRKELEELNIGQMTPLEALNRLAQWKESLDLEISET